MATKLTRRQIAAALAGTAPALTLTGAGAAQETEEDPLNSAREQIRESVSKMEEFELPISVEPAFIFKP